MVTKHIWSVLCKESITNQDDNLISLIGVLEEINSVVTPLEGGLNKNEKLAIPFNLELVNYWIKENETEVKLNIKIEIIDPNTKRLAETINQSIFPANNKRLRTRLKIQGIPISTNGRYIFKVSIAEGDEPKFKLVAEIPLDIKNEISKPLKTSIKS